jgi:SAM-dependent methyltransferase
VAGSYAFGDGGDATRRLAVVHRVFVPLAVRLLDDVVRRPPRVVADLGCGPGHTTGFLAERWPAADVIGVDVSPAFLAAAASRAPGARFVHGDVTDAGALPAGRADLVYARCLLAHLPDVPGAIATWRAWLAPGGRLLLEEPERIATDDPVFRTYLAATARAVAARGATMLAGPLVARATTGLDSVVLDRVLEHRVATSDAATMFALNLTTIRNDPLAGLDPATASTLDSELAVRRDDHRAGAITWYVRQVAIAA